MQCGYVDRINRIDRRWVVQYGYIDRIDRRCTLPETSRDCSGRCVFPPACLPGSNGRQAVPQAVRLLKPLSTQRNAEIPQSIRCQANTLCSSADSAVQNLEADTHF